ncbi:MAG: L-glutamate gamma-semialdehyde dehydrogenase [bacterium]
MIYSVPEPKNEPILSYAPDTPERMKLLSALKKLKANPVEVSMIIGGQEVKTKEKVNMTAPHNHDLILGYYYRGGEAEIRQAIAAAMNAKESWAGMAWQDRAAIFLKAAELISGPFREEINAATMLGQSKNIYQAEIDAVCELADFFRFNAYYMQEIYKMQPYSPKNQWNRLDYRPLDGFVFAVTPFNFTSIAGNLPTAPAMMGNTVVWKPASSAVYSAHFVMKILNMAGLPPGVINLVTARGSDVGKFILTDLNLSGIHFTGSTSTFQQMWKTVGDNIAKYKSYPRIVGETGGKDFIFAHPSAHPQQVAVAILRAGFEYQGQKCSAASRCYLPESLWGEIKDQLSKWAGELKMGDVEDFENFINAVIDKPAFQKITAAIEKIKQDDDLDIIFGGNYQDTPGWFISPTLVEVKNPKSWLMETELFGPVVGVYVYPDKEFEKTLELCDQTSPYALTGSIFSGDRQKLAYASEKLRFSAGNFYLNDKCTAAVVGQQPFGGSRASGTNDKAGSILNMIRWTSPRAIKETLDPPLDYRYPFMKN